MFLTNNESQRNQSEKVPVTYIRYWFSIDYEGVSHFRPTQIRNNQEDLV